MGPGPALDAFVQEAPKSHVVIGPDGEVEPGKYDRVAITVRDRGELRALRVPKGVRTRALAVWLDESVRPDHQLRIRGLLEEVVDGGTGTHQLVSWSSRRRVSGRGSSCIQDFVT